ncbi:helix-turn-helix domain-containing protein [Pelagicoccus mobilis]|uniref:Helix-turn-helix domain-containing protein n=1 Tax=Pelagicoccus mobilis TaxID=415221 RepID=A0A934S177_9BACT|nr:helix-turn-helix domain-containing protein [Pelagicoccus mobilis]MBK1877233.1 helix-turn-helix domain-containing protein [Pelagicoccus mobilis]
MIIGKAIAENDDSETEPEDLTGICHTHDHPELVVVIGGSAMHLFEGVQYPVSAGDVFCILDNQRHCFLQKNNLQLMNVMYSPVGLNLPLDSLARVPGYKAMFSLEPSYRKQHGFSSRLNLAPAELAHAVNNLESMYSEQQKKHPGYEAFHQGSMINLLLFLSRKFGQHSGRKAGALVLIEPVISAIEKKPETPWTLKKMSDLANLTQPKLSRSFKDATGMAPLDYLINLRIRLSMELLAGTQMSVTDIAFEVGFNDSNYFARQFKRINNLSATEYRNNIET